MLRKVALENFKSFRDARFPLGEFTLIVGANGSGKSNFFDALRFLRFVGMGTTIRDAIEGHSSPGQAGYVVPGVRGGSRALTHLSSPSRVFKVSVTVQHEARTANYTIAVDAERYRVVDESLTASDYPGSYVFDTNPDPQPLNQDAESPAIFARFYKKTRGRNPKRAFSHSESILSQFRERRAESTLNEEIAEFVRTELASIRPLELRPEVLRQYAPLGAFELGEHGENLAAVAWLLDAASQSEPEAKERKQAIEAWLSELTPHPVKSVATEESPTGEVIFALRESPFERSLSARSLSDGTLRFAALAFAALGTPGRQTLVVEELENGIHPARLALLVRMLEDTVAQSEDVQVLASTHAPGILDMASERTVKNSLVVGWDSESSCSVTRPIGSLPQLEKLRKKSTLGDLQAEGWFQLAVDQ